jgi:hypothetical protein
MPRTTRSSCEWRCRDCTSGITLGQHFTLEATEDPQGWRRKKRTEPRPGGFGLNLFSPKLSDSISSAPLIARAVLCIAHTLSQNRVVRLFSTRPRYGFCLCTTRCNSISPG